MKTIKTIFCLGTLVILLINCTGEKGAIGPQGSAGQQGSKGDKGEAGVSGEFSKTQTGTFSIKAADWKTNSIYTADDSYYFSVPVSAVSKDVLDKGIISVWWASSATQQFCLPYDRNNLRYLYASYLEKGEGRIRIDIYPSSLQAKAPKPTSDLNFRWVIN